MSIGERWADDAAPCAEQSLEVIQVNSARGIDEHDTSPASGKLTYTVTNEANNAIAFLLGRSVLKPVHGENEVSVRPVEKHRPQAKDVMLSWGNEAPSKSGDQVDEPADELGATGMDRGTTTLRQRKARQGVGESNRQAGGIAYAENGMPSEVEHDLATDEVGIGNIQALDLQEVLPVVPQDAEVGPGFCGRRVWVGAVCHVRARADESGPQLRLESRSLELGPIA